MERYFLSDEQAHQKTHPVISAENALTIAEGYDNQQKQTWSKHGEGKIAWRRQSYSEKTTRTGLIYTEAREKLKNNTYNSEQTENTENTGWKMEK